MFTPWYQLKLNDDGIVSPLTQPLSRFRSTSLFFPIAVPRRYAIVCVENVLQLQENEPDGLTGVFVVVNEKQEVKLEVSQSASLSVKVNDETVDKGNTSAVLKENDRVNVGDRCFILNRIKLPLGDVQTKLNELKCSTCAQMYPRILKCGHMVCSMCLNRQISAAMRQPADVLALEPGIAGIDMEEILAQIRTINCGVCNQQYSCWEAMRAVRPVCLAKAIDMLRGWPFADESSPKCDTCLSLRCVAAPRDYEFCERCDLVLCPTCAVEGHRDHELRNRASMVKRMHDNVKNMTLRKLEMRKISKLGAEISNRIASVMNRANGQLADFRKSLSSAVGACDSTVQEFEARMNPFEETNADLPNRFTNQVDAATKRVNDTMALANSVLEIVNETKDQVNAFEGGNANNG